MKEETIEKTVEVADKAIDVLGGKMVDYLTGVENIISQYGGDAANLALNVLRIEAISGALVTIFMLIAVFPLIKFHKKMIDLEKGEHGRSDPVLSVIFGSLSWFIYALYFLVTASIWNFIGAFYPEMYAVHKFIM